MICWFLQSFYNRRAVSFGMRFDDNQSRVQVSLAAPPSKTVRYVQQPSIPLRAEMQGKLDSHICTPPVLTFPYRVVYILCDTCPQRGIGLLVKA